MEWNKKLRFQFNVRSLLSIILILAIWVRVDWTVGLFALLVIIENEIRYLKLKGLLPKR